MACTDLSRLNLSQRTEIVRILIVMALKTTCIKNVKFKIIKVRTGRQHMGYFYYSESINATAENFPLGRVRTAGSR